MEENHQNQTPTSTDNVRPRPTMSDSVRPRPTLSPTRGEKHTLTSREALQIFEQSGLLRSQRSIERYCKDEKLDCFFDSDEQRYYVTEESVERLIGHIQEIQSRHEPVKIKISEPTTSPDHVRQGPTGSDDIEKEQENKASEKVVELEQKVAALTKQLDDKNILLQAKDYFVERFKEERQVFQTERKGYVNQLIQSSRLIGQLETKVQNLLGAPAQEPAASNEQASPQETESLEEDERVKVPLR